MVGAEQAGPAVARPGLQPADRTPEQSGLAPSSRTGDGYAKRVFRRGSLVVISRQFANEVREDNSILLSKVAIKVRLNANGDLRGYEAVQVDKGSVVEQMGFRSHDLLTSVNAIPAGDLNTNRESLESADRFDVTIIRRGKTMKLRIEIR